MMKLVLIFPTNKNILSANKECLNPNGKGKWISKRYWYSFPTNHFTGRNGQNAIFNLLDFFS